MIQEKGKISTKIWPFDPFHMLQRSGTKKNSVVLQDLALIQILLSSI